MSKTTSELFEVKQRYGKNKGLELERQGSKGDVFQKVFYD